MKIIITGGLGYIGTELCNIYSGESRFKDITVIDNRFISERVNQLRNWGINFINGDITDLKFVQQHISNADIIIHLAGITDVAYVKSDTDLNKEKIIKTGVTGTRNILETMSDNSKIIFPSTHVVFEGFNKVVRDIDESVEPCPKLTYAVNKRNSEIDIINSRKKYVILRLGSVYGYSTDTMRIGIMPNLFSKITSQNGTINLFGGGVQLKSLVNVKDVARCFKFFEEDLENINQIFHLSNENTSVLEVAKICKSINSNVQLFKTEDEIPNLGYTISNKKLLKTGFNFLYNLRESIQEMIQKWSFSFKNMSLEYIEEGGNEFIDNRGVIRNYELTEPINLIGYIESKKGSVRANHYHPIQEQKCLLISGKYISVVKDLANTNSVVETRIINKGDLAIIHPNVAHTMVFLEDSVFLNLVRGEREHENYGITHTIKYEIVDDTFRKDIINFYRTSCRVCQSTKIELVVSLGKSPLANNLLEYIDEPFNSYPLELNRCKNCNNCQLSFSIDNKIMFDNYLYTSSTSLSFIEHFNKAAEEYINSFNLNKNDLVIDIGSNDGIGLLKFKSHDINVLGIEPAKNICKIANDNGINTLNRYFDLETVSLIKEKFGKPKLILASNVFAHNDNLLEFAKLSMDLLEDDGVFIFEVQYLLNTLKDITFDNIYHEHYNYWSVSSLVYLFNKIGYKISKVKHINTHGGSIRVYVKKNNELLDESCEKFIQEENRIGIKNKIIYHDFSKKINELKNNFNKNIKLLKEKFGIVAGYGAPAKATTKLNFYNIGSNDISFIVEDNKLKHNKYIPGVGIKITDKNELLKQEIKVVIVIAWNFYDQIIEENQILLKKGVKFISIRDLELNNLSI